MAYGAVIDELKTHDLAVGRRKSRGERTQVDYSTELGIDIFGDARAPLMSQEDRAGRPCESGEGCSKNIPMELAFCALCGNARFHQRKPDSS